MIRWRIIREKTLRLGVALLASIVVRASFPDGTVGLELVDEMLYSAAFRVDSPLQDGLVLGSCWRRINGRCRGQFAAQCSQWQLHGRWRRCAAPFLPSRCFSAG